MFACLLEQLAKHIDAKLHGDGTLPITGIASMKGAVPGQITFLADKKFQSNLSECKASAVVMTEDSLKYWHGAALIVNNPYLAYAKLAQYLDTTPNPAKDIAPSAVIDSSAKLGNNVSIGANAVIESNVILADNCIIGPGCFIGKNTKIGAGTKLWANVSVYHNCIIGENCLIQSGTVIGADGFGYANDKGKWIKIPQLGRVVIGNNVEIGASTTIDRGALDDTIIGNGVIIDNYS